MLLHVFTSNWSYSYWFNLLSGLPAESRFGGYLKGAISLLHRQCVPLCHSQYPIPETCVRIEAQILSNQQLRILQQFCDLDLPLWKCLEYSLLVHYAKTYT